MAEKEPKIKVKKLFTQKSIFHFSRVRHHEQRDNHAYNGRQWQEMEIRLKWQKWIIAWCTPWTPRQPGSQAGNG